jgi:hypothetical protein
MVSTTTMLRFAITYLIKQLCERVSCVPIQHAFYFLHFMCHKKYTMLYFCDIKNTECFYEKIGTRYANRYNALIIK